ncbi:MAG: VanZ family protein [Niameybacter sp.]
MLKKCESKVIRYKFTMGVVILILIGILMPGESVPQVGIPGLDKVVHFGMFFVLTGVYYLEYLMNNKKLPVWYYAVACLFVFAGSTEVMQLFASSRSMDILDLSVDTMGIFIASLLWVAFVKLREGKVAK